MHKETRLVPFSAALMYRVVSEVERYPEFLPWVLGLRIKSRSGHIVIAEGKIKVRPLRVYHGKVGRGLSVEMSVKRGPVTLLSVVEDSGHGFKLLAAHAESVPGEVLRIGNTNSHYRFPIGARRFVEEWNAQGPAHHCAIGIGHLAGKLSKLARLLGIPFVQVC